MTRGEGRIFARGKSRFLWVAYCGPKPGGDWGEIREPVKPATTDEEKARDFLRRRRRAAENHRDGIETFQGRAQERITVGQLLDNLEADYRQREIKSLRQTLGHVKPLRSHFGAMRAVTVTPDRIRAYITLRQEPRRTPKGEPMPGISNAKINRETEILGRAFRLAVDEGRLSHNPKVPTLPERNVRQGFFEKAEFEAIVPLLPAEVADVTRFGYLTGWRLSEITGLRWENVDRAAQEVRIYDSKNGDGRTIPLDGQLLALIEKRWGDRQFLDWRGEAGVSAFVFHRQGRRIGNFRGVWTRAAARANVPGKLFHDLRRTAVRDMIRAGVPQAVAQTISGHRTAAVFSRYNISSAEDKIDALRKRESYLETRDSKPKVVAFRASDSDTNSDTVAEK